MKAILQNILCTLLASSTIVSVAAQDNSSNTNEALVSVEVQTKKIEKTDISDSLQVYGEIIPDPDYLLNVSMPSAGLINRVWVKPGQRVRHGDKLLEIITAPDARMQYVQAQGAVEFARKDFDRKQQLLDEQLTTRSDVEVAQKVLEDSQSMLLALQRKGLQKTQDTVLSPVEGIITEIGLSQGQRVSADTTALLIANQNHLVVRLGVEPEKLSKLSIGMPIILKSVFVSDIEIKTSIRDIHAMINPLTNLVDIYVDIPGETSKLLVLGSRVVGNIYFPIRTGFVVPRSAVLEDPLGSYIFRIEDNLANRINVMVGSELGNNLEIIGDLNTDDRVVVIGNYELKDGIAVREKK